MPQSMKLVAAIVDPFKFDEVLEALERVGAQMPTVTQTRDYRRKGRAEIYRGAEYTPSFVPMVKIEIDVPSDQVDLITETIAAAAMSGQNRDVRIRVLSVERDVRIHAFGNGEPAPRRAA